MKALRIYKNAVLKVENIEEPIVGDNEVKVQVKACGICGSDIPRILSNGAHYYPITLGHEFSGIVSQIGKNVKNISISDHVSGIPLIPCMKCNDCFNGNYSLCKNYNFIGSRREGAMAEYVVVPEENVLKINNEIDFNTAAFIEPLTVVLHAFYQNSYISNSNVAVLGLGTIGSLAVQMAKTIGAKNITVFVRNNVHNELAYKCGANNVVNTSDKNWKDLVNSITSGEGFNYVFETAGSSDTIKKSFEIASNKAHVCLIGTPKSEINFNVDLWEKINRKEFYLTGSWMSYSAPFPGREWIIAEKCLKEKKIVIYPEMINTTILLEDSYKIKTVLNDSNSKGRNLIIINSEANKCR